MGGSCSGAGQGAQRVGKQRCVGFCVWSLIGKVGRAGGMNMIEM